MSIKLRNEFTEMKALRYLGFVGTVPNPGQYFEAQKYYPETRASWFSMGGRENLSRRWNSVGDLPITRKRR